jgi:hypothetical protein
VSVARPNTQQGADVDPSVHAGEDGEVLRGLDDAGRTAEEMETRVHQHSIDRIHALHGIYTDSRGNPAHPARPGCRIASKITGDARANSPASGQFVMDS